MDPYIGEIRIFGGNFAPTGWRFCDGSLLRIDQYQALFAVIGNMYGGSMSQMTFALPDLRGRAPIDQGAGPNLTPRTVAQSGGTPTVTLTQTQMPVHTHTAEASATAGAQVTPKGAVWAEVINTTPPPGPVKIYAAAPKVTMAADALTPTGQGGPHANLQPFLGVNFIIAVEGIFPPHS